MVWNNFGCRLDEELWPKIREQLLEMLRSVVENDPAHVLQQEVKDLEAREAAMNLLEHELQLAQARLQADREALEAEIQADKGDIFNSFQADQQRLHSERAALEAERAVLQADRADFEKETEAQRLVLQEQLEADKATMDADLQAERELLRAEFAALEQELRTKLSVQEERLQTERRTLEEEKERVFCGNDMSDILQLNIGGIKTVAVQRGTLCAVEGSMLASSFSGRWDDSLPKDNAGAFFIDFDPELFLPLLEYLRLQGAHGNSVPQVIPQVPGRESDFASMLNFYCIGPTKSHTDSLTFKFAQPAIDGVSISPCGRIATRIALPHWKRAFGDVLLNRTLLKSPMRIAFRTLAFGDGGGIGDECGPHVGICDGNIVRADDQDEVRKPDGMYTFRPLDGLLMAPNAAHIVGPSPRVGVGAALGDVVAFIVHPDGQATLERNGESLGIVFRCLPEIIRPVVEMNYDPCRVEVAL